MYGLQSGFDLLSAMFTILYIPMDPRTFSGSTWVPPQTVFGSTGYNIIIYYNVPLWSTLCIQNQWRSSGSQNVSHLFRDFNRLVTLRMSWRDWPHACPNGVIGREPDSDRYQNSETDSQPGTWKWGMPKWQFQGQLWFIVDLSDLRCTTFWSNPYLSCPGSCSMVSDPFLGLTVWVLRAGYQSQKLFRDADI